MPSRVPLQDRCAQPSGGRASTATRAAKRRRAKPWNLAVRALVRDAKGRLLLLRRSAQCRHFVGQWEFPGGKTDPGEAFDAALRREVREETGLAIELLGAVGTLDFEMPQARVVMLCMETRRTGGTLRLSEEHDAHAWVTATDMAGWSLVPQLKELARVYARRIVQQRP